MRKDPMAKRMASKKKQKAIRNDPARVEAALAKRMAFADHLKALVHKSGFTTKEIAEHCQVTAGAVSNWFATGRISKDNLAALARKLRISSDQILLCDPADVRAMTSPPAAPPGLPPMPSIASTQPRRTYSLEALELAYTYDNLPSDFARAQAQALLANLEAENPLLQIHARAPEPAVKPARRKPSVAPKRAPSAKTRT